MKKLVWALLLSVLLAAPAGPALGLSGPAQPPAKDPAPVLLVNDVSGDAFPDVALQLRPMSAGSSALTVDAIKVSEDGFAVPRAKIALQPGKDRAIGLVLAVDVSMPAPEFEKLRQSLKTLLTQLRPDDEVSLLTFNEKIDTPIHALHMGSAEKVQAALDALVAGGSFTALNAAISAGIKEAQQLETAPGHRALLVFTDSGENTNTLSPDDVAKPALSAHVPVYLFGFSLGKARPVGSDIPQLTGGKSVVSTGVEESFKNVPGVVADLRKTYALRYHSALKADGQRHTLKIEWQPGAVVPAEQAFVATQSKIQLSVTGLPESQWLNGDVQLGAAVKATAPVQQVEFILDGQPLGSVAKPPYQLNWDTSALKPGEHTLIVRVTDEVGNVESKETKVQAPPATQLQLNMSSGWVWAGNSAQAQADVQAVVPISQVEVLVDGHVIDVRSQAPYLFDIPTRYVAGGKHTISVQALDALGRSSTSAAELYVVGIPWRYVVSPLMALLSLILGGSLISQVFASWRNSQVRTFPLQVQNTGNAPSRYLLRIAEQRNAQALQLKLIHNGARLPLAQVGVAQMEAPIDLDEGVLAASGGALNAANANANAARAQGGAALAKGQAAVAGAAEKAAKVGGMAMLASETLLMLGSWVPGDAGVKLKEVGGRIQQAQFAAKRATSAATKVKNVAATAVENTAAIAATASGAAGKANAAGAAAATAVPPQSAARTARAPRVASAAPTHLTETLSEHEISSTVAAHMRANSATPWSITPMIPPGDALTLGVVAVPSRPQLNRSLLFTLELESRSAEDESGLDAHGSSFSLDIQTSNGWIRYRPFVLAFAIGLTMLAVAAWFLWIGGLLR